MSASSPRRLLCAACLVGFLVSIAGLFIRSQAFLRFAGVRLSADGILDSYTVARAGTLAAKLFAAGLLIPLIAAAAPWLLRRTPAKRGEGVLAAMAIAALCLGFLWLVDIPPYQAAAMRSQPDEIQYTIPAINLLTRGRLVIVMNGLEFPPYTAIGFQLILVPFYRIFGTMIGNGIRAVQAGVILSLLGTYVLGTIVLGKKRGLLAALLLASNPCFIFWSRGIMPSTVTTMLTIVIALLTVAMARQAAFAHGAAGAALLGFITGAQICIAFSYVYVAPAVFIVMLYVLNEGRGRGEVAKHALLFGLAFCGALLPLLLYQHAAYGGFFTTGYDAWYWARPPGESPAIRFSLAPRPYDVFLLELIGKLGWDTSVNRIVVFILDLAGLGSLYNIATFLLILSGLRFAWTKAPATGYRVLLLFIGLFLAFTAAGYSFLLWAPTRYMLPIVPLVLLVCADGFYSGLEHAEGMGSCFRQLLLCSLLGFALLEGGGCAWQRFSEAPRKPLMYELARAYAEIAGDGSVVVSGISGAYLCHFLPADKRMTWLPISELTHLAMRGGRPLFPIASENPSMLAWCIEAGRPVYIDDWGERRYPGEYRKLRERFDFEPVKEVDGCQIFRLHEKIRPR